MNWFRKLLGPLDNSRARRLRRYAISDALWEATLRRHPFLIQTDAGDARRLRELATLFLSEKTFSTAGGLTLIDEMVVSVAAQAVLPVLHIGGLALYHDWVGIVLYPGEFRVRRVEEDEIGLVHAFEDEISGETFVGGPVVLSWPDIAEPSGRGPAYNVVIHEFAHKLDMLDGEVDGIPPLLPVHRGVLAHRQMRAVLEAAFDDWCRRCDAVDDEDWEDFCASAPLDPYAGEHAGEFFPVCAETFFVAPERLEQLYPAVSGVLERYFRPHLFRPSS